MAPRRSTVRICGSPHRPDHRGEHQGQDHARRTGHLEEDHEDGDRALHAGEVGGHEEHHQFGETDAGGDEGVVEQRVKDLAQRGADGEAGIEESSWNAADQALKLAPALANR